MAVDPASPYQTGPNSSDLWIRKWALTLKGASGDLTLSQSNNDPEQDGLRITFRTQQTKVGGNGLPGQAIITIYNPTAQTVVKAQTAEFNRAILAAGYKDGRYGIIFDGIIAYWEHGREETLTETYLRLHLQDGDLAFNWASINQTLTSGHSVADAANAAAVQLAAKGTKTGSISGVPTSALPRGQVLYGNAKDILDDHGLSYFTQNGTLHIFDPKKPISSQTKVLNSMTGLVGMPRQTTNGVEATTLLDPTLLLGAQVQIDQKDINQVASSNLTLQGTQIQQPGGNASGIAVQQGFGVGYFADVSADGLYAVWVIEHEGDSRGDPWYSHMSCYAAGQTPNVGSSLLDYGQGPTNGQITTANAPQSVPDWGTGGP